MTPAATVGAVVTGTIVVVADWPAGTLTVVDVVSGTGASVVVGPEPSSTSGTAAASRAIFSRSGLLAARWSPIPIRAISTRLVPATIVP